MRLGTTDADILSLHTGTALLLTLVRLHFLEMCDGMCNLAASLHARVIYICLLHHLVEVKQKNAKKTCAFQMDVQVLNIFIPLSVLSLFIWFHFLPF